MGNETNTPSTSTLTAKQSLAVSSPSQKLNLTVGVSEQGAIWYELTKKSDTIINKSHLALLDQSDQNLLTTGGSLAIKQSTKDETWEQPWGEQRFVRDNHTELSLTSDSFAIHFRLFDNSLGFRYELKGSGQITLKNEQTEFNITPEASAWWIPALGQNHYEHLYKKTLLTEIDTAHTPLTVELPNKTFIAVHEAALYDYGAMNLVPSESGLTTSITPLNAGYITKAALPFQTPWRTVIISDTPYELGNAKIMLNLNEPSAIADTSWITPTKFMGIWWGMFMGQFTWASGEKHGATTANAFRYINAAHNLGISALLIEGWNEGWDGDWTQNGDKMNHMKPYADFDIHAISSYALSKDVQLVGHHETSGNVTHYESELPEAYDYYKHLGVQYIKTGYVAPRMDNGEFHSSQAGVVHYQKTVEMAAERQIMLDIHEPVKGTGIERTWPNLMTREGVMGQEYEGGAVTPEHTAVLPFTRLLAGPLDYTPGLFNLSGTERKVSSTLAKQLAFYVTMYSPMQMAADLPEHYLGHPAFEFIKNVPVNWERTVPLAGEIGEYYAVARKDRNSDDWYFGAVSDEQSRTLSISTSFLQEHRTYKATVYRDDKTSDWQTNPESYVIERIEVNSQTVLDLYLAPGGGVAIQFSPEGSTVSPYPAQ